MKDSRLESPLLGHVYKNVDSFIRRVSTMGFIGENRDRVSALQLRYMPFPALLIHCLCRSSHPMLHPSFTPSFPLYLKPHQLSISPRWVKHICHGTSRRSISQGNGQVKSRYVRFPVVDTLSSYSSRFFRDQILDQNDSVIFCCIWEL